MYINALTEFSDLTPFAPIQFVWYESVKAVFCSFPYPP